MQHIRTLFQGKKAIFGSFGGIGGIVTAFAIIFVMNNMEGLYNFASGLGSWILGGCFGAFFITCGLILGQDYYIHRQITSWEPVRKVIRPCFIGGGISGLLGRIFASIFAGVLGLDFSFGRIVGWAILGGLVGNLASRQVANLDRRSAVIGGFIGGTLGCLSMYLVDSMMSGSMGFIVGLGITGYLIGVALSIFETLSRKGWLDVSLFSGAPQRAGDLVQKPRELQISLGDKPIKIGYSSQDDIRLEGLQDKSGHLAEIYIENNQPILLERQTSQTRVLTNGETLRYGNAEIKINI